MTPNYSILIIEDEKNILEFMSKTLKANGYRVTTAATGKAGLAIINSQCPDIILLDLGLPDIDGNTIISSVRKWTSCPIIVISARMGERDKVTALDLGADDYITKPFGTSELLARIRASLRHSNRMDSNSALYIRPYRCGELILDFEKRMVTLDGEIIHLTPVEYKIVAFLAKNSGKVMTYSAIMSNIWGPYTDNNNRILRVNMANIRRKIEKNPSQPEYLFTEVGVGYRMQEDENELPSKITPASR
ncbi:response regulator transcription factor [Dorea sp. YH-dor228]|uniref:response regulator transcription factor n=1 Tax=Lachnospiraceae TaxID=186803 RepID=UPI002A7846F2|nr:response regulator transcription factor [Lachnospiraceae bacterium]MDY2614070.1 response regulator transcription factor [Lachnospiraceae bacterium]MDY4207427.1 response regulator transcription factor [Lachnospiraceae bacterium]